MAKKSARDRMSNEVNAGSMADIAFLLLIFFLVTTTIDVDKGVLVKLPPWSEEPPEVEKMKTRNVYSVLVNAQNQLLVRGEPASVNNLRDNAKEFIMNPRKREDMAEKPTKAIISIKNDRGTSYETYLEVYNELKAAYNELRNEEAQRKYGKEFEYLTREQQREIRSRIPLVISEAEPTNFGEEN
ncbi:MAG: biopolymer transporter ExbD [Saprospiraceae bacterium]|nr:biopolymer transporter ExbD [Saprospiraceae bacterium]